MREKRFLVMMLAVVLMALPALAQTFGAKRAEQPNTVFQSTSTMTGSGSSYSSNPTLNSDGTASYNGGSSVSGPRRAKMDENPFGDQTIGGTSNPNEPATPLGDAVLPLLLMSLAFCGAVYLRRRKVKIER